MENQVSGRIAVTLTDLARRGADAGQIAEAIVSTWKVIDTALSPVVGKRGVEALYRRSLYLTSLTHPWLVGMHESVHPSMDLAALKSRLVQQGSADAASGGGALLQTFRELLTGLVGPALTDQLLHSVAANFLNAQPAQDPSP